MRNTTRKLVLSGLLVAVGLFLPFLTGQIPNIGSMLLPMHIPVLLAGFVVGPFWGALVGLVTPLLRHFTLSMPPLQTAITMTFELAAYGFLSGFFYSRLPKKPWRIFASLIIAMLGGRIVWALVSLLQSQLLGASFTLKMFLSGAFLTAIPGIIVQLIVIPLIVVSLEKAHLIQES